MPESWTILRLLAWTTEFLKSHGSDTPRLDAEVLLAHARGCERIMLYAAFDEVVGDEQRAAFRELVKRRAAGEPVAYLVGQREFYSLALKVTPDVLIPRPETEFVVVAALDVLGRKGQEARGQGTGDRGQESGDRGQESGDPASTATTHHSPLTTHHPPPACPLVADVGTGSGAIAIAIAKHAPHCRVVAIDVSPAALAVARENAVAHAVDSQIEFVAGDLLAALTPARQFAVIASNPPYIAESELASLSATVRDYEPPQALIAGPQGTEIITRLIPQAAERLAAGGWLILEVSPHLAPRVIELVAADGRFEPALVTKDLAGLARVVRARRTA
jgi:release factor glutamine methyltransferase